MFPLVLLLIFIWINLEVILVLLANVQWFVRFHTWMSFNLFTNCIVGKKIQEGSLGQVDLLEHDGTHFNKISKYWEIKIDENRSLLFSSVGFCIFTILRLCLFPVMFQKSQINRNFKRFRILSLKLHPLLKNQDLS